MESKLVIATSDLNESFIVKAGENTIGRDTDNDIQIPDSSVSRHHCVISNMPSACEIKDLNSTNGLFVNGDQIEVSVLRNGDQVRIGDCAFTYEEMSSESSLSDMHETRDYSTRVYQDTVRFKKSDFADCAKSKKPLQPLRRKAITTDIGRLLNPEDE